MIYKTLADLTIVLHLAWIIFLFIGAFWGVRNRWVKGFHLFALSFAFLIQILDWYCPLTHLEAFFLSRHNPSMSYAGSFIIYYLEQVVYLQVPPDVIVVGTILLCGVNLLFYFRSRKGNGRQKKTGAA
jgi:hypothetical protein